MNAHRAKRGRSPCPVTKRPSLGRRPHGPADEPHPCPCECPAFQEVRRLEARVAELEAELQRATALLTDAFHDDPAVQTLRRRLQPPDGHQDTYAAAASRSAWRDRVTAASLGAIRAVRESGYLEITTVDPAVTARLELLSKLCAVQLPTAKLERLAHVLSSPVTDHEQMEWVGTLRLWCLFRLGRMSLDEFLAAATVFPGAEIVFGSQVAVDEFFLPMASQCPLASTDRFAKLLECADVKTVATAEFRDRFFLRLVNSPTMTEDSMIGLAGAWIQLCFKAALATHSVFLEPQFVLDFCVRRVAVLSSSTSPQNLNVATIVGSVTWPLSLVPSVRDHFLVPTMRWAFRNDAPRGLLVLCLRQVVQSGPEAAALFCTTNFRDEFFMRVFERGSWMVSSASPIADALTKIAATAPRAERQAMFVTERFRDKVIVPLIRQVRDKGAPETIAAVRAALLTIAENDDGSLHEVFAVAACHDFLAPLPPTTRSKRHHRRR